MTIHTSKKTATFRRPFAFGRFDEAISLSTYRRVATRIDLHPKPGRPGVTQTLTIDPHELDVALKRDQAPAKIPAGGDASEKSPKGTTESCREAADRQAIERGVNEGMLVRPE
jgi:hypothetical protein